MAETWSVMKELGSPASPFDLPVANPSVDSLGGETRRLDDYSGADVLVLVFTCNHCPFALHVEDALAQSARTYADRGVRFIAINANDAERFPGDSFEAMRRRTDRKAYPFPYLFDDSQEVAKAYGAVCTPDFFVFDRTRKLVYRGRYDETRPGRGAATGRDLHAALDQLIESGTVTVEQRPSIGCNIKWKPGNEPA